MFGQDIKTNSTARKAGYTSALALALLLSVAATAQAQNIAEPRIELGNFGNRAQPQNHPGSAESCNHGSGPKRFYFRYTNGDFDSGVWTGKQEMDASDLSCLTHKDGDTDIDAAHIHLSCSEDYTLNPTAVGNGLTVAEWAIYRPGGPNNNGVCGNIDFPGHLIIAKETIPNGDTTSFDFTSPSSDIANFSLQDGGSKDFFLQPGSYDVSETLPSDWELNDLVCSDPDGGSSVNASTATVTAELDKDETVVCTFTNEFVANTELNASIAVLKKTNGSESNPGTCTAIKPDASVNWDYTVTNTGDVPVDITSIVDDAGGGTPFNPAFSSGDADSDGFLDTDETWIYTASGTAAFQGDNEYVNTVTVNGTVADDAVTAKVAVGDPVSASDKSCYITPGINIEKSDGGISVNEGANFAYTLTYSNTGGVALTGVTITETVPVNTTFNPGGTDGSNWNCAAHSAGSTCTYDLNTLAVGENGSVQFPLTVDELWEPDEQTGMCPEKPQNPTVNNSASIADDNGNTDPASDDTPITVACDDNPATLTILKVTDPAGSSKSFAFTGSSAEDGFNSFSLTGAAPGNQQSFTLPGGSYSVSETVPFGWEQTSAVCDQGESVGDIDLAPGESVTCTFTNARLTADIAVLKLTNGEESNPGSCTGMETGESVTWTYQVTNPGELPLQIDTITDDAGTPGDTADDIVINPTPNSGDGDTDGLLDPGETWAYTASGTVGSLDPYTNTVTVNGTASDGSTTLPGQSPTASDQSCYDILEPGIHIEKTDSVTSVPEGGTVVYTLSYENTGETDLTGVTVTDTVPVNTTFDAAGSQSDWSCADGDPAGTVCSYSVGNLNKDATGSVTIAFKVDNDLVEPDPETGLCPEQPPNLKVDNLGEIQDDDGNQDSDPEDTPITPVCEDNPASLTIVKQTVPAGNTTAIFSFASSNVEIGGFTLTGDGDSESFPNLPGGNYNVTESATTGWSLTAIACTGSGDFTPNLAGGRVDINLDPGEDLTCTFTNTQDGTITIVKQTDPANDATVFDFTGDLGTFTLTGQAPTNSMRFTRPPDTYQVSESAESGWVLESATCTDQSNPSSGIVLDAGENVTCTFKNRKLLGTLIVAKVVKSENEADFAQVFDFSGPEGAFELSHGQQKVFTLEPGTYSVSESVPEDWTLSATCDNGDDPGSVTIADGETVKCTFTNKADGTIIVEKDATSVTEEGANQVFTFTGPDGSTFTLLAGETERFDIPPALYDVIETVPPGWEQTSAGCNNGDGVDEINLVAGGTVTCTFFNKELQSGLAVDKKTNGVDGDTPPGIEVPVGSTVTWTYAVSNPGEQPAEVLSIVDNNGTTGDTSDDFTPDLVDGDTDSDGQLDPGEVWHYQATGTAEAGQYTNKVTVEAEVLDNTAAKAVPGTALTAIDISRYFGAEMDIAIEKTDGGQAFVPEGGTVIYTLSYENVGSVDVTGVVITETVPANTTFNAGASSNGWSCTDGAAAGTTCTFNVGALAAGATGSVLFALTVNELVEPDPETGECPADPPDFLVDNTGSIADDGSNGPDADTSNNTASDNTPVAVACEPEQRSPNIRIVKNPPNQLIQKGETANFSISVTNTGDVDLVNVVVTDPATPSCDNNIGNLAIGQTVVYNCSRENVRESFTNVAIVNGETPDGGDVSDDDDAKVSILTVDEPGQHATPIPTLSQWGLIFMAGLMLLFGASGIRFRTRR